ncbi:glycerophosphodiester phosphodiesterase family protein [Planococcus maritimus]|nr:glycerophosphodiester phosphodiesterase family protein [Planococcus sp. SK3692]MDE4083662.1 glycerophosphodiester phosphodiesterase family protein [Planococcus maritimus]
MSEIEIYAHRGASGHALENTWQAFELAHQLQVGIELDIQMTRDGIAIIYHDDQLKRLAGMQADIYEMPYESLKSLSIRKRFKRFGRHSIPLAYEVIDWAKKKHIPLNIELKSSVASHPEGPEIVCALLEGVEHIHLSSFDGELLREMKRLLPHMELAWILKRAAQWNELEKWQWVDSFHFHKRFHKAKWLEPIARLDKPVRLYGISGNERMLKNLHPLVKGVITDYPARVKTLGAKKIHP